MRVRLLGPGVWEACAIAPIEHTFLFADLAGFTALTEIHGDEPAAEVADEFFRTVRTLLGRYAASEVKTIGDAVMLRGGDPAQAVELGLEVVERVGEQHGSPMVRVGMHTGPGVERNGDWFGAAVNLAARVSGMASGGEVLLTDATKAAVSELDGVVLHERGRHALKNVARPVLVYAAQREGACSPRGLPIDPVCRMTVDPHRSAGRLTHAGVEYHFCSLECAARFAGAPAEYTQR